MSEVEPVPEHLTRAVAGWARYKRLLRRLTLMTAGALLLALIYSDLTGEPLPARAAIAALAAAGLLVLLATGLLGVFLLARRRDAGESQ
jgi:hypothetical protein